MFVSALLLVRPAWLDQPGRPHLNIIEDIGQAIMDNGAEGGEARLLDHPFYAAAKTENPDCAASVKGAIHRPQAVEAAGVLSALVADQPFAQMSQLGKCTVPALVVARARIARVHRRRAGAAIPITALGPSPIDRRRGRGRGRGRGGGRG